VQSSFCIVASPPIQWFEVIKPALTEAIFAVTLLIHFTHNVRRTTDKLTLNIELRNCVGQVAVSTLMPSRISGSSAAHLMSSQKSRTPQAFKSATVVFEKPHSERLGACHHIEHGLIRCDLTKRSFFPVTFIRDFSDVIGCPDCARFGA